MIEQFSSSVLCLWRDESSGGADSIYLRFRRLGPAKIRDFGAAENAILRQYESGHDLGRAEKETLQIRGFSP